MAKIRPSLKKLSAVRSIALRVLFKASQTSDVGTAQFQRHGRDFRSMRCRIGCSQVDWVFSENE
jgi:hypothetical protein